MIGHQILNAPPSLLLPVEDEEELLEKRTQSFNTHHFSFHLQKSDFAVKENVLKFIKKVKVSKTPSQDVHRDSRDLRPKSLLR